MLVALLTPAASWAETCKYLDADGRVIYSNTPGNPPKGAKKVKCFEDPVPQPAAPQQQSRPAGSPAASEPPSRRNAGEPGNDFPKVDGQTQKKRDEERRKILEQELASEQEQLEEAKLQLSEQESVRTGGERNYQKFLERVEPFRQAVANHERNIEAIKREISNLK
jgi:hypothetical protein